MSFNVPFELVPVISSKSAVAGIIVGTRSGNGKLPMYSDLVKGGTNIYGYQVGFTARITADPERLILEIAFNDGFNDAVAKGHPLPDNVWVEADRLGNVTVAPLPLDVAERVDAELAMAKASCQALSLLSKAF